MDFKLSITTSKTGFDTGFDPFKNMQCIHVVFDFEHDFTLVRRNRTNGFAQVSNLPPLGNSFIRFHESHEFGELSLFDVPTGMSFITFRPKK